VVFGDAVMVEEEALSIFIYEKLFIQTIHHRIRCRRVAGRLSWALFIIPQAAELERAKHPHKKRDDGHLSQTEELDGVTMRNAHDDAANLDSHGAGLSERGGGSRGAGKWHCRFRPGAIQVLHFRRVQPVSIALVVG